MTPRTRSPTRDHMGPAHHSLAAKERDNGSLKICNMVYDCNGIARLINLMKHKTICGFSIISIGPALAQVCLITPHLMGGWYTCVRMCMRMYIYVSSWYLRRIHRLICGLYTFPCTCAQLKWVLKQLYAMYVLLCYERVIWRDYSIMPKPHIRDCTISVEIKPS